MQLAELARRLNARLEGSPENPAPETIEVTGVAGIEEAGAHQVTFVANPKYAALTKTTQAAAVLVTEDFPAIAAATLRTANPYLAFARAIEIFYQTPVYAAGIHPTAIVAPTAKLGRNCHVGAYAVIEDNVEIGDDAVVLAHVVIYPNVRIGNRFFAHSHSVVREGCPIGDDVTLQNGAVVGSDGFGFAKDDAGTVAQDSAIGPGHPGRPRRGAGQCMHRSSQRGRNADWRGSEGRQPGAGGSWMHSWRKHAAVFAGGAGRFISPGKKCDSSGTGRGGRTLFDRRWIDSDGAERGVARCSRRKSDEWIAGTGQ